MIFLDFKCLTNFRNWSFISGRNLFCFKCLLNLCPSNSMWCPLYNQKSPLIMGPRTIILIEESIYRHGNIYFNYINYIIATILFVFLFHRLIVFSAFSMLLCRISLSDQKINTFSSFRFLCLYRTSENYI